MSDTVLPATDTPVVDTPEVETPKVDNAPVEKKKYKVKVDGAESEVDEDELLRGYQTRKASAKHLEEAAAIRKQAENFLELLKTNPRKVLSHPTLGHDLRKFAEEILGEALEDELMEPSARELKQLKQQLKEREEKEAAQKAYAEEQIRNELKVKYTEHYQNEILKTLEAADLPKTPETVKRMAYYMHQGLSRSMDLKPSDVVDLVKEDYMVAIKSLFGSVDGEKLMELLGEDVTSKIRKVDVSRVKNNPLNQVRTPEKQAPSKDRGKVKPKRDLDTFMRSLKKA